MNGIPDIESEDNEGENDGNKQGSDDENLGGNSNNKDN